MPDKQQGLDPALLEGLRAGRFSLFFRHTATDDMVDTDRHTLENCATQHNLNPLGRQQAQSLGRAIRAPGIPIGEVLTSAFC